MGLYGHRIIAGDFMAVIAAALPMVYVFVAIEHHSRRLACCNVAAHRQASWHFPKLGRSNRFKERDQDLLQEPVRIFASQLDESVSRLGA